MRFRALIITRKKLILIIAASAVTALIGAAEAMCDFKPEPDAEMYRAVLEEGMGTRERRAPDLGAALKRVLGFDMREPATIIDDYAGVDLRALPERLA